MARRTRGSSNGFFLLLTQQHWITLWLYAVLLSPLVSLALLSLALVSFALASLVLFFGALESLAVVVLAYVFGGTRPASEPATTAPAAGPKTPS